MRGFGSVVKCSWDAGNVRKKFQTFEIPTKLNRTPKLTIDDPREQLTNARACCIVTSSLLLYQSVLLMISSKFRCISNVQMFDEITIINSLQVHSKFIYKAKNIQIRCEYSGSLSVLEKWLDPLTFIIP